MVAPSVPCTLLTPMSPQSLSFRPLVIPESSLLTVRVPPCARSHAR
jgi:NAD+ kinase